MNIIRETHKRVDYNIAIQIVDELLQEIKQKGDTTRVKSVHIDVHGEGWGASHTITVDRIERAKRQ